ncbi:MAG: ATP-binding protein [Candidatus Hydrogenedentes bacterium]|nr:ATP-binding protein [Candidatus Hydrogenedentota bacterium]
MGTIRDVSQSKEAEQAVLVASRMEATATLARGIAHEFNNLMVGVLGNAQLLELRSSLDNNGLRMLRAIGASAQQASELAQKMLAFARGGKYETRIVDMNEVVRTTLQLEKLSFPPRITTETDLSPDLWPITADPVQMSQIVMSLSLNAAEAIKETGKILVATRNIDVDADSTRGRKGLAEGPHICLTVRDDGEGMDPGTQARIFEPFFSTKFPGRGLGLAAAYGIVKNHGGHISVSSEPGVGTVMEVYLPAAAK